MEIKQKQLVRFRHNNNGTSYPEEYGDNDTGRMRTQRDFIMAVIEQTAKSRKHIQIRTNIRSSRRKCNNKYRFQCCKRPTFHMQLNLAQKIY